jgi:hypothetical protein
VTTTVFPTTVTATVTTTITTTTVPTTVTGTVTTATVTTTTVTTTVTYTVIPTTVTTTVATTVTTTVTTTVNTTLFHATLKTAKIEGYPPPSALYSEPDGAFKNAIKAQPEEVVVPTVAPVAAPPPAAVKPAVVETAPVPFAPAPPAPQPAAKSEKWPNDDFKTLLSLLREHMAIHNLKSLTITETGVSFKRIEVVEGDLAL